MSGPIAVAGVPFELTWEGELAGWRDTGDSLEITAAANTDWFFDPGGPTRRANVPRLMGSPVGDFQLSAKVTVDLLATFDAGAIVLAVDEQHWAKLLLERSVAGKPTVVSVVTRGGSDDCDSYSVGEDHTWLRVSSLGNAFAFHASSDGAVWRFVRYFSLACDHSSDGPPARVGFEAQSPTGPGCTARFSEIRFVPERLADLRDGR